MLHNLSSGDKIENSGDDNVIQWRKITNIPIASCTKLQLSPNNYTLTESLKITAVSDFIINGNDAMFHCNSSSMTFSNSIRVQILNEIFINCGCTLSNFTKPNNLFPSFVTAAIIIQNSPTMTIINIMTTLGMQ